MFYKVKKNFAFMKRSILVSVFANQKKYEKVFTFMEKGEE